MNCLMHIKISRQFALANDDFFPFLPSFFMNKRTNRFLSLVYGVLSRAISCYYDVCKCFSYTPHIFSSLVYTTDLHIQSIKMENKMIIISLYDCSFGFELRSKRQIKKENRQFVMLCNANVLSFQTIRKQQWRVPKCVWKRPTGCFIYIYRNTYPFSPYIKNCST